MALLSGGPGRQGAERNPFMSGEGIEPLRDILAAKRHAIIQEWLARTARTYPEHMSRFLLQERDPFRNPVGHTLREGLPVLLDGLLGGADAATVESVLDGIVRIRAVQDFTPAQAVAFIFLLKPVIRDARSGPPHPSCAPWKGGEEKGEGVAPVEALAALDARVDELALLAFDLFMRCRERMSEIRVGEARRRVGLLLKRQALGGRTGETENRGNGDANSPVPESPVPRPPDSRIQDWSRP
jgi:hypothetical protein